MAARRWFGWGVVRPMPFRAKGRVVQKLVGNRWTKLKVHSSRKAAVAHAQALGINVSAKEKGIELPQPKEKTTVVSKPRTTTRKKTS